MARKAYSLDKLLEEINVIALSHNARFGWIGDKDHQSRQSDHNPDKDGVVLAIDIWNDLANGVDCNRLAQVLFDGANPRINYIIWNRRIYIPFKRSWATEYGQKWQTYTGDNPHTNHLHISVNKSNSDNTAPWQIGGNDMYPNKGDLINIAATTGFPRKTPNQQDIDHWTKGIGNTEWAKGADHVWKALFYGAMKSADEAVNTLKADIAGLSKRPTQTQLDGLRDELKKTTDQNIDLANKLKAAENKPPVEKIIEIPADDSKRSIGDLLSAIWKKLFKIGVE